MLLNEKSPFLSGTICSRMIVNKDHKILNSPPLSKEIKKMSSIFPSPGPEQRNQYPSPCFPQHITLVGPGYLPQGEANDMTVIQLINLRATLRSFYPLLSIKCSVLRVFKLVKATQNGVKLKQRCDVTGDRTRDLSHWRSGTNHLYHSCSC